MDDSGTERVLLGEPFQSVGEFEGSLDGIDGASGPPTQLQVKGTPAWANFQNPGSRFDFKTVEEGMGHWIPEEGLALEAPGLLWGVA